MIRRRTITSYVWNSVSGNKMVILLNCIRNFFRKFELTGNSVQGENSSPDNPQEIKSAGRFDEASGKYLLDVKVTGKNLLDMADIQNENGKIDSDFSKAKSIKPFKVIKDRKYLLISKGTMIVDVRYSSIYFGEDDLAYEQGSSKKLTTGTGYSCFIGTETRKILVAKETCTITKTMMHGTRTEKDAYEVEELGLFEIINDNPNIDYEPYTEQTVQIILDEPLRECNGHKDMITKDSIIRNVYSETKNTIPNFQDWRPEDSYYRISFATKYIIKHDKSYKYKCNLFKKLESYIRNTSMYLTFSIADLEAVGIDPNGTKTDANLKIKEFISQNPLTFVYALDVPITEPLTEPVQAQLQALHSENGVTHVFVDSGEVPCGINIEYKTKS